MCAVLEAQDRVGGRTLSVPLHQAYCDLGGQWVGPSQKRLLALAEELHVETHLQYCHGNKILDLDGRSQTYTGDIPLGLSVFSLIETQCLMWQLHSLCKTVPTDFPHRSPHAQEFDSQSCQSWLDSYIVSQSSKQLATAMIRGFHLHSILFI